jgi:hypothetical protein
MSAMKREAPLKRTTATECGLAVRQRSGPRFVESTHDQFRGRHWIHHDERGAFLALLDEFL